MIILTLRKIDVEFFLDIEGLKRKLSRKLSPDESCMNDEWQVGLKHDW